MVVIVIAIVLCGLIYLFFKRVKKYKDTSRIHCALCFGVLVPAVIFVLLWGMINPVESAVKDYEIVTMGDNYLLHGRWGIFGGSIDEKLMYSFYVRGDSGALLYQEVQADKVKIKEGDYKVAKYCLVEKRNCITKWKISFVGIPDNCEEAKYENKHYMFYLPEGSIEKGIKLDSHL